MKLMSLKENWLSGELSVEEDTLVEEETEVWEEARDEVVDVALVEVEDEDDERPSVLELTTDVELKVVPVNLVVEEVELVAWARVAKVSADATISIATITSAATTRMEGGLLLDVALDRPIEMTATMDRIQAMKMSPIASGTVKRNRVHF